MLQPSGHHVDEASAGTLPALPAFGPSARHLLLQRHVQPGRVRFELSLPRAPDCRGAWMFIFLGSEQTLSQLRLDQSVATLHLRMARWRATAAAAGGSGFRLDRTLLALVVADPPTQDQLRLGDVLAWSGRGRDVTFLG